MHDLDFFDDIMADIKSGGEKKPAIKVTGMPGKHVPPGILSTMNDLLSAVGHLFTKYLFSCWEFCDGFCDGFCEC